MSHVTTAFETPIAYIINIHNQTCNHHQSCGRN